MLDDITDKSIDEQGERMVPAFHKGALVYGEHIARYNSIVGLLKEKVVLDIASGTGYGSYILAEKAKKVIGVELDQESVEYAKRNYSKDNIEYFQGNAEQIPLEDKSIDIVVTFETIEHVKDYRKFLKEIKRVLKPNGLAIVSTPNDLEFPEGNHFHLHEFKEKELDAELRKLFKNVKFGYQYTWFCTGVTDQYAANTEGVIKLPVQNLAPVSLDKALYFIVICSDKDISKLEAQEVCALSEHYSARKEQYQKEAERLKNEHIINALKDKLNNTEISLRAIYHSKGWKLLTILYGIRQRIKKIFDRK